MGKDKNKDKVLCPCFQITKDDIKKAISQGATSFKDVKRMTNASQKCGHCKCEVKKYTEKKLKKLKKD